MKFTVVIAVLTVTLLMTKMSSAEEKKKIAKLFKEKAICMDESEALEDCVKASNEKGDSNANACEAEKMLMDKCIKASVPELQQKDDKKEVEK